MNYILIFFLIFELLCIIHICKINMCLPVYQENIFHEKDCSTNILVIIPAHNEGLQVRETIRSIKHTNYPKKLIEILLLNDDSVDNTVNIALEEKIKIITLNNKANTKGEILNTFCLNYKSLIRKFDYLCIIDADTLLDPNFFIKADHEFKKGFEIVQGEVTSIKYMENSISCFMELFQLIINYYSKYQNNLKKSVMLEGKGFLMSPKIFEKVKWDGSILVEDVDFSLNALLNGYFIQYCPQMKVKTKQIYTFQDMWIQQRRYASGQLQILKKYHQSLSNDKLIGVARAYIIQSFFSSILFLLMVISLLNLRIYISIILSVYICTTIIATLIAKSTDIQTSLFKNILCFPFMLFCWHIIYIISFFKPETQWKCIKSKYQVQT